MIFRKADVIFWCGWGLSLAFSTGCWSFPESGGTWSGTVTSEHRFVDNRDCQAAVLHISDGTKISPSIGDTVNLVDKDDHLIDGNSFTPGSVIKVKGTAGYKTVTCANAGTPTGTRGANAGGAASPSIEVDSISLENGEKVNLRLAVAQPTTMP